MNRASITLQVFFQEPFWIGVIERTIDDRLDVCKITFGSEPQDQEVYNLLAQKYLLLTFSPVVKVENKIKKVNPKRRQREAKKSLTSTIGTKSQQALKLQHEQNIQLRKEKQRMKKQEHDAYQFQLKQQKRKEKHRGR